MPQLYLVATPIGNLGDFSPRGVETLKTVDFILAEDTRVTRKLCSRFDIHTPTYSYHKHNEQEQAAGIVGRLLDGASCAVVSDAGMPCISDPGSILVQACVAAGIAVTVVPGANAAIAALAISGISATRFTFEGFLTTNRNHRSTHLAALADESRTMIFYEAPHKLLTTLTDLAQTFGADRAITLVRELTKLYEEVQRLTLSDAVAYYTAHKPKGEFVLIVAGATPKPQHSDLTLEQAVDLLKQRIAKGEKPTEAAKQVAKQTPYTKSQLYRVLATKQQSSTKPSS